jgi:hypothetical protein
MSLLELNSASDMRIFYAKILFRYDNVTMRHFETSPRVPVDLIWFDWQNVACDVW